MKIATLKSIFERNICQRTARVTGVVLLSALLSPVVLAADGQAKRFVSEDQNDVTAREAANAARQKVDGRVISVKPQRRGERGYRVRILAEGGRVVTLSVDERGKVTQ